MDVVRASAAGAIAACAMFGLLSITRHVHAEPPPVSMTSAQLLDVDPRPAELSHSHIRKELVSLTGPAFAAPQTSGPAIHIATMFPHARLADASSSSWDELVNKASRRFGMPSSWVRGVMRLESGGRTLLDGHPITSSAGAMGLMQVMPETFAAMSQRYRLGTDPYEPRANIFAGTAFLREMYDRYGAAHFLAAYNAGPGRVDDFLRTGRPLPYETQRYVNMLAPQLLDDTGQGAALVSPPMQDLTSVDAMRRAGLPPFRRPLPALPSPKLAPLLLRRKTRPDHVAVQLKRRSTTCCSFTSHIRTNVRSQCSPTDRKTDRCADGRACPA